MPNSSENASEPAGRPSLSEIGEAFLRLGSIAFGGLGATLALLQRELAERHRWVSAGDISEALAFTKPLPGSTVVQVVTFLGWRLHRWPGAIVATVAFLIPSLVLMTVAAAALLSLPDAPWVKGALTGLQVTVVGLLASAFWRLAQSEAPTTTLTAVLTAAFVAGFFVDAALVVAGAGLVGVVVDREPADA